MVEPKGICAELNLLITYKQASPTFLKLKCMYHASLLDTLNIKEGTLFLFISQRLNNLNLHKRRKAKRTQQACH